MNVSLEYTISPLKYTIFQSSLYILLGNSVFNFTLSSFAVVDIIIFFCWITPPIKKYKWWFSSQFIYLYFTSESIYIFTNSIPKTKNRWFAKILLKNSQIFSRNFSKKNMKVGNTKWKSINPKFFSKILKFSQKI